MQELFAAEFSNLKSTNMDVSVQLENGTQQTVKARFYFDFPEKVEFVGFFIPASERTYDICTNLVDRVQPARDDIRKGFSVKAGDTGGSNSMNDLTFSGRVFLYHESPLTIQEKAALQNLYSSRNFNVWFRDIEYVESPQHMHAQYAVSVSDSISVSESAGASVTSATDAPTETPEPVK